MNKIEETETISTIVEENTNECIKNNELTKEEVCKLEGT